MNHLVKFKKNHKKLHLPEWINYLSEDYVQENVNDCGDKATSWFVPNDILGLDIRIACRVHDLEYQKIINKYRSWILKTKEEKEQIAKSEKLKADIRLRENIKVLADYKFKENKNGVFSLIFWRSELRQAKARRKEHYKAADLYFWAVKNFGWSSLEKSFKK